MIITIILLFVIKKKQKVIYTNKLYKKSLSQHYLRHKRDATRIAEQLSGTGYAHVLEIGAGTGQLTQALLTLPYQLSAIEKDADNVEILRTQYANTLDLFHADATQIDWLSCTEAPFALVGNFPYHITSPLLFGILAQRKAIPEVVCMVQQEVGERLCSLPGRKTYGLLSVLLQAFYRIEPCFTLSPACFIPPPRVNSMVLRLQRTCIDLPVAFSHYLAVVKTAFGQRRKMLRNALKPLTNQPLPETVASLRAEALSPLDFINLCAHIFPPKEL